MQIYRDECYANFHYGQKVEYYSLLNNEFSLWIFLSKSLLAMSLFYVLTSAKVCYYLPCRLFYGAKLRIILKVKVKNKINMMKQ